MKIQVHESCNNKFDIKDMKDKLCVRIDTEYMRRITKLLDDITLYTKLQDYGKETATVSFKEKNNRRSQYVVFKHEDLHFLSSCKNCVYNSFKNEYYLSILYERVS